MTATLVLTIREQRFVPPSPVDPEEDYPDWPEEPEDNLIPGKDDDLRPVPRIVSLDEKGLLRIVWDSEMVVPTEYRTIPGHKSAVKDWSAFT